MTAFIRLLEAATRLVDHLTPLFAALESLMHTAVLFLLL